MPIPFFLPQILWITPPLALSLTLEIRDMGKVSECCLEIQIVPPTSQLGRAYLSLTPRWVKVPAHDVSEGTGKCAQMTQWVWHREMMYPGKAR